MDISLKMKNIKNVESAEMNLPFSKGLYAIVGENGCGKSTIMLALSLMVKTSSAHMLSGDAVSSDSLIEIEADGKFDKWYYNAKRKELTTGKFRKVKDRYSIAASAHFEGFYEGSIFYGCRFDDYNLIDTFMQNEDYKKYLIDADAFVIETLGYILHNSKSYYNGLKKISDKKTATANGFKGIPYFYETKGKIISQYKMSSGECMLISLIDFLNNVIVKNPRRRDKLLFLIDEVELALHPSAIDRLVLFLQDLVKKTESELVIYFSTHSAELIHRISARNIYLMENNGGKVDIINPCYPNYAIRNLYIPNGFDFVLLVEDELAKAIVRKVIMANNLSKSKLCCILPAGGCMQMLKLHHDMVTYNTLGVGKSIISIYDGDVKDSISKKEEYKDLPKCFLPIPSVEKYLKKKLVDEPDRVFIKQIGDRYFTQRSLDDIIADYMNDPRTSKAKDNDGKNLYKVITSNLDRIGISEEEFIKYLADDIYDYENPQKFVETLKKQLS